MEGPEKIVSNVGVKQGCPLSPTCFGIFIVELEVFMENTNGGVQLGDYVIKLLLYADDVVLVSKTTEGLQHLLHSLESFYHETGMKVNK